MTTSLWFRSRVERYTSETTHPAVHRTLLIALCLLLYVPASFRGLLNSDETRYAEIVREMLESGEWIVPHLNYVPYFMKPPLVYWLAAIPVKVLGFSPVMLRLWPLAAAIVGVLATYELGRALGSRRTGLIAGGILATSIVYFILAVSILTDMIFTAFLIVAWLAFWRHYEGEGAARGWIALCWLAASGACLTKGPLGLILVLFTIGLFLVLRGQWRFAFRMRPLMGLAVLVLSNLPWMILIYLRDPRYLWFFYLQVSAAGVRDAVLMHSEPFYYYFKAVPLGLFPWSLFAIAALVLAVADLVKQGPRSSSAGLLYLVSMVLGGVVLLSIPAAKLMTYSLPLYPAAALLTAHYLGRLDGGRRWVRSLVPCLSAVIAVALVVGAFYEERRHMALSFHNPVVWVAVPVGTASVVGLVGASVLSLRGRVGASLLVLGLVAAIVFQTALILAPTLASWRTSEGLCKSFTRELAAADLVVISDPDDFSVPLTLKRRVAIVGKGGELGMGLFVQSQPNHHPVPDDPFHLKADGVGSNHLLDLEDLRKRWAGNEVIYLFATRNFLEKLREAPLENLWSLASNGETALLTNRRPPGQ